MAKRKIIEINDDKCTGCGECIPNCHEGALQIIDNKARLISDLFCDGLGACIGHCPTGAMKVVEREAQDYDEKRVMEENIVPKGENTIKAHVNHLKDHGATKFYNQAMEYLKEKEINVDFEEEKKMNDQTPCGCPGAEIKEVKSGSDSSKNAEQVSALKQWPILINLIPASAPFLDNAHLLVSADCTGFACPNYHSKLLHGKVLAVGCPKFDDIEAYQEKFTEMFKQNNIKSVTVALMEVPCCSGLYSAVEEAVAASGKNIPIIKEIIAISGEIL
jgi:ferredoxin